ncbi:hypothetical protein OH77DRAFT_784936 [Trametes cingulata]|nr:hypothetical protein OH77DRAFT_784936 [Trametes cingulata]
MPVTGSHLICSDMTVASTTLVALINEHCLVINCTMLLQRRLARLPAAVQALPACLWNETPSLNSEMADRFLAASRAPCGTQRSTRASASAWLVHASRNSFASCGSSLTLDPSSYSDSSYEMQEVDRLPSAGAPLSSSLPRLWRRCRRLLLEYT